MPTLRAPEYLQILGWRLEGMAEALGRNHRVVLSGDNQARDSQVRQQGTHAGLSIVVESVAKAVPLVLKKFWKLLLIFSSNIIK